MQPSFQNWTIFPVPDASEIAGRMTGNNAESVLLVYTLEQESSANLSEFLGRIVKSVGLDLNSDTASLTLMPGEKISLSQLRQQIPFNRAILFGLSPAQVGLRFSINKYIPVSLSGRQYLFADSLESIYLERREGGKQKAGLLWKAMKTIFDKHQES